MTLCRGSVSVNEDIGNSSAYHLQRPDSPDPHLQLALDAADIVELNALPPAAACGFPPEQEKLLRHPDGITVGRVVALDVGAQACERNAADDGLVGLAGTVTPEVVVVEATVEVSSDGGYVCGQALTLRSTSQ
jgi:hypothetical protein